MFSITWYLTEEPKISKMSGWENRYLENQKNYEYVQIRKKMLNKDNLIFQQAKDKEDKRK